MPAWTVETTLEMKNGNRLVHFCTVDADDEAAALKKAKRVWNRDIQFGRGSFSHGWSAATSAPDRRGRQRSHRDRQMNLPAVPALRKRAEAGGAEGESNP